MKELFARSYQDAELAALEFDECPEDKIAIGYNGGSPVVLDYTEALIARRVLGEWIRLVRSRKAAAKKPAKRKKK